MTSPVQWSTGSGANSCAEPNPEACTFYVFAEYPPGIADYFNIYETDGITLSATLSDITVYNPAGSYYYLESTFLGAGGTVPLTPFPDANSIIETGGVQTVDTIDGIPGLSDNVIVQIDTAPEQVSAPEPGPLCLLATVLVGVAIAGKWRSICRSTTSRSTVR